MKNTKPAFTAKSVSSYTAKDRTTHDEQSTAKDGEISPLIPYQTCIDALRSSAYHQSAVNSKAEYSVGMGYELYDMQGNLSEPLKEEWETLFNGDFQGTVDKVALDFETFGNAFFEVETLGATKFTASALHHVPARTIVASKTGNIITYKQKINNVVKGVYPQSDGMVSGLLHISQYSPSAHVFGEPDWIAALKPVSLDASATSYNDAFFKNGCMPQWAIVMEESTMDDDTEKQIKEFFEKEFMGSYNSHKTLLLSGGGKVEFIRLQVENKEMSFLSLKSVCRDEIAAAHNIPPRLMGIVSAGSLGGNGEMQWQLRFFENGKLKKRRGMYQNIFNKILNGCGKFKFMGLDLSLEQDDANYYGTLVSNGILDPVTARRELGFEEQDANLSLLEGYLNGKNVY